MLFTIAFLFVIGNIVFRAVAGISRWQTNNRQPLLTIPAVLITKRTQVNRYTNNSNGQVMSNSTTDYFLTFQVQSGDRIELKVKAHDFGLLAERDTGQLSFQGTRFESFERNRFEG